MAKLNDFGISEANRNKMSINATRKGDKNIPVGRISGKPKPTKKAKNIMYNFIKRGYYANTNNN